MLSFETEAIALYSYEVVLPLFDGAMLLTSRP